MNQPTHISICPQSESLPAGAGAAAGSALSRLPATCIRLALAASLLATTGLGQTLYVNAALTTGADDGSSWSSAFQSSDGLERALAAAPQGAEIWIAAGTYFPSSTGDTDLSFLPDSDVALLGGFVGNEGSPADRPGNGLAPTTLNGDYLGDDASGAVADNANNIVRIANKQGVVLDRLIVRGGVSDAPGSFPARNQNGGGVFVRNSEVLVQDCSFEGNRCDLSGSGLYSQVSEIQVLGCRFDGNGSTLDSNGGAAAYFDSGGLQIDRCLFTDNVGSQTGALGIGFLGFPSAVLNSVFTRNVSTSSSGGGGAMSISASSIRIEACTIYDNHSEWLAGGISGDAKSVTNCILWNNVGYAGNTGSWGQADPGNDLSHCIIQGGHPNATNLSLDPRFVDPLNGDLRLRLDSPAIDAATTNTLLQASDLDFLGRPRIVQTDSVPDSGFGSGTRADLGAIEVQGNIGEPVAGCTPTPHSAGGPARLLAAGGLDPGQNDLTFLAIDLPVGEFGYFLFSESSGSTAVGSGQLCLGSPLYRFTGDVLNSGGGSTAFTPDLGNLPQGQVPVSGATYYFQFWFRDQSTSNLSSALSFAWQ